ncbi:MAG: branched-chain amino acid ABC transporter permease [Actinomycetota bacterium]|nr:branched-chain amino acid ABC transporter permease [Actinomycetota bacterium]
MDACFRCLGEQFAPQTLDGLTLGAVYALIALGYTLVYGVLRLINFAHSEIFMIGVFASLFALEGLGVEGGDPTRTGATLAVTLAAVMAVAMVASGLTAVAMERVAYRPLRRRGAPRLAALITAIGISLFLQELFALRYGRDLLGFPRVMEKRQLAEVAGADVRTDKVLVVVAALVLMFALDRFVAGTRLGRGVRATAQDPETAALMGVNIDRVVVLTFLLGGLLAGAAGTLYGVFFEAARYNIGFLPGIKAFTAAVLGGIGNIRGALLGGLLLGLLENWGATVLGGEWKDVFAFTVLVMVLMFRPTGLLGESLGKARA